MHELKSTPVRTNPSASHQASRRSRSTESRNAFCCLLQKQFSGLVNLSVKVEAHSASSQANITLNQMILADSAWSFSGLGVVMTECQFPTSSVSVERSAGSAVKSCQIGNLTFLDATQVTMKKCSIRGQKRVAPAVQFQRSQATVFGGNFLQNELVSPLILITDASRVTLQNVNFTGNQGTNGIIHADDRSRLELHHCFLSDNHASENAGCILLTDASHLFIYGSRFRNNSAANEGGVIFTRKSTHVEIDKNSEFEANRVTNYNSVGGVISSYDNVTLIAIDTVFRNNYADFRGGVISAMRDNKVLLFNVTFHGNRALDSSGAIQCYHNCLMNAQNCFFKSNVAKDGGGIETYNATLIFNNCTFENNTSLVTDTGALTAVVQSRLHVKNCTFSENRAARYGPAMQFYDRVDVTIEQSNFTNNVALYGAGAIYAENNIRLTIVSSTFRNNTAARSGGALIGGAKETLTATDVYFINNTALTSFGGAISGFRELNLSNTHFLNNTAGFRGGAVCNCPRVAANYSTFENNHAHQDGGALFCTKCNVFFKQSNFSRNTVVLTGGAVSLELNGVLEIEGGVFQENRAIAGDGGAIVLRQGSVLSASGSKFIANSAFYGGGAINLFSQEGELNLHRLNNVYFEKNHVHFMGAAIYVGPWVRITATDCRFVSNFAETYGGAIKLDESSESCLESCFFFNNTAISQGGALYVKQQHGKTMPTTKTKMSNTAFVNNKAKKASAIYIFSNDGIPSPKLLTLNTVFTNGVLPPLNTSDEQFANASVQENMIISEPDPVLEISESPFASGKYEVILFQCQTRKENPTNRRHADVSTMTHSTIHQRPHPSDKTRRLNSRSTLEPNTSPTSGFRETSIQKVKLKT